jgi:hypothetical protein
MTAERGLVLRGNTWNTAWGGQVPPMCPPSKRSLGSLLRTGAPARFNRAGGGEVR